MDNETPTSGRHDGEANSGWIRFPTHLENSGEGGMWVIAAFLQSDTYPDPFYRCCVDSVPLVNAANVVLNDEDTLYPTQKQLEAARKILNDELFAVRRKYAEQARFFMDDDTAAGMKRYLERIAYSLRDDEHREKPDSKRRTWWLTELDDEQKSAVQKRSGLNDAAFAYALEAALAYDKASGECWEPERWGVGSCALLAAVILGTSGGSWWDAPNEKYWTCRREDLTPKGEALVASLEELYQRPALLVTFLDT